MKKKTCKKKVKRGGSRSAAQKIIQNRATRQTQRIYQNKIINNTVLDIDTEALDKMSIVFRQQVIPHLGKSSSVRHKELEPKIRNIINNPDQCKLLIKIIIAKKERDLKIFIKSFKAALKQVGRDTNGRITNMKGGAIEQEPLGVLVVSLVLSAVVLLFTKAMISENTNELEDLLEQFDTRPAALIEHPGGETSLGRQRGGPHNPRFNPYMQPPEQYDEPNNPYVINMQPPGQYGEPNNHYD